MLYPGLYEQVINHAVTDGLAEIPEARKAVAPIDPAEAAQVLSRYLCDVVEKGLENVLDNGGDLSAQVELVNRVVDLIQNTTQEADFAALGVDRQAEQLLALLRERDPRILPNTRIKVSCDTRRTRLRVKAYVFCRGSDFTTACAAEDAARRRPLLWRSWGTPTSASSAGSTHGPMRRSRERGRIYLAIVKE